MGFALGCGVAGLLAYLAAPLAARVPGSPELSYVVGYSAVAASICAAAWLRARAGARSWRHEAVLLLAGGAVLVLCQGGVASPGLGALIVTALLAVASTLGAALGRRIEIPGHVLAVVLVSGLVDLWSVLDPGGPSAQIAEAVLRAPDRLSSLVLPFPALGTGEPTALIGGGDVLFAALYAAALHKHGVSQARCACAIATGFAIGMLVTLWLARPIPLLPLIGAAVLCTDRRLCSLAPKDRRTVAVSVGVLLVWVASRIAR